jgi:hypothetical protein
MAAKKKVQTRKKPGTKKPAAERRRKPVDIEAPVTAKRDESPPETGKKKFADMTPEEKKAHRRQYREERKRKQLEAAARAGAAGTGNGNGAHASAGNGTTPGGGRSMQDFRIVGEFTAAGALAWRIHERSSGEWRPADGTVQNPVEAVQLIARKVAFPAGEPAPV